MCQPSNSFGNQDNIVDTILRIKQIFKVSSAGQGHVIVILIRKFGSRNVYVGPGNTCIIIIVIIGIQGICAPIHAKVHTKRSRKF